MGNKKNSKTNLKNGNVMCGTCPTWEDGGSMAVSAPGYLHTAQTIEKQHSTITTKK